tara:strand:- start:253 stop:438 length:186 start_codon:yes stop_codon:yes gene_type:complete
MSNAEQTMWQYNTEYSYEANMSSWIDAVTFERSRHSETKWTQDQAEMKFMEIYPRSEYGKT